MSNFSCEYLERFLARKNRWKIGYDVSYQGIDVVGSKTRLIDPKALASMLDKPYDEFKVLLGRKK